MKMEEFSVSGEKKTSVSRSLSRSFFFIFIKATAATVASYNNNNSSLQVFPVPRKSKHTADICKQHGHLKILNFEVT